MPLLLLAKRFYAHAIVIVIGWALLHWDGKSPDATSLADLDLDALERRTDLAGCKDAKNAIDRKPEAIHVDGSRVLVLSDGLCDGGPTWFDLPGT